MAIAVLMEGGLGLLAVAVGWLVGMNPLDLVAGDWWAFCGDAWRRCRWWEPWCL